MEKFIEHAYNVLEQAGWVIIRQENPSYGLPLHVKERYPDLPPEWAEFASRGCVCMTPEENGWFLCANDFENLEDGVFHWDELERISLQAAREDQNAEWESSILCFWNDHLPIYLSVIGEYEYYAIRMADGAVVHGIEPEFEETDLVAPSFTRFLEMVCAGEIVLGE